MESTGRAAEYSWLWHLTTPLAFDTGQHHWHLTLDNAIGIWHLTTPLAFDIWHLTTLLAFDTWQRHCHLTLDNPIVIWHRQCANSHHTCFASAYVYSSYWCHKFTKISNSFFCELACFFNSLRTTSDCSVFVNFLINFDAILTLFVTSFLLSMFIVVHT